MRSLLRDDAEALALWREATKGKPGRKPTAESVDNVNALDTPKGNTRAYTLDRLKRQAPELFEQVKAGELSANAAAIRGF